MPNRGYPEMDGRMDPSGGLHDTEDFKRYNGEMVQAVAGLTSVGEQIDRGGFTRSDTPVGIDPDLPPPHRYQGGSANSDGRHVVADYPPNYG